MAPDEILSHLARILTRAQREQYFEHGYVMVERLIPDDVTEALNALTTNYIDRRKPQHSPAGRNAINRTD